jgi:hypothetical protein
MSFAKNEQSDKRVIAKLDTCLHPETGGGLSWNVAPELSAERRASLATRLE